MGRRRARPTGGTRSSSGELREGFDARWSARSTSPTGGSARSSPGWRRTSRGQLTWGLGAPDEAQASFERPLRLPYVGERPPTGSRSPTASAAATSSRGEIGGGAQAAVRRASRRGSRTRSSRSSTSGTGAGTQVAALAVRVLETSRRTGNRWDEWASHHLAARVHHLRGELEPAARAARAGARDRRRRRRALLRAVGAARPRARARRERAPERGASSTSSAAARSSPPARTGAGAPGTQRWPRRSCWRSRAPSTQPTPHSATRRRRSNGIGCAGTRRRPCTSTGRALVAAGDGSPRPSNWTEPSRSTADTAPARSG